MTAQDRFSIDPAKTLYRCPYDRGNTIETQVTSLIERYVPRQDGPVNSEVGKRALFLAATAEHYFPGVMR